MELDKGLLPVVGKTKESGTTINFLPDDTIFDRTRFKEDEVKSRLHETAYLNPELTIIYEDKRGEETEHIEYHEPEGIVGFIKDMNKSKEAIHDVIYYKGESEGITVEAAFQYVNEFHENVLGFCNNIYNAEGGTHLTGFKTMFTNVINTYARGLNILKEKDVNFTGADVRNGMTAVVSIKHPDPRFEGHVYIAMPPLYKAMPSKGEEEYLYDDKALEKYRKRHKGPFTLQRYKGLGEMDAQQLWETTLDPDTRMLKLVEIEDARMASEVTELLMGTEVPPRKEFIYRHAQDAELDI